MSKVVITTESGSDIPAGRARELGVRIVPMHVTIGERTVDDGSLPGGEMLERCRQLGVLPKTSGCTPVDFHAVFDRIHEEDPQAQILHLAYSAATTCSLDSARIASQDRDYVTLLDTRLGSAALALVVEGVVRWLAENPDAGAVEAAEYARDLSARAHMAFIPGDLGYLRAGGRLSNAAFVGATLLRIRPVIEISEGRLVATRKLRGSMASCVSALIDHVAASCDAVLDRIAFIRSTGLPEQVQDLAERHARELGFRDVVWYDMLNVVTAHGGPGTFGAAVLAR